MALLLVSEDEDALEMEEDTELEEGEAGMSPLVDPSGFSSNIDERLETVLGEQQRQFFTAGVVDAAQLGAKFGAYGSFLPTQVRQPSVFASQAPDGAIGRRALPEGHVEAIRPQRNLSIVPGTSNGPIPVGNGEGPPRVNGSVEKPESHRPPPLTLRFKVGPNAKDAGQKSIVALLNHKDLGLGPGSGGDHFRPSPDRSPMSMIQTMTHHLPEGGLISPLSQSLCDLPKEFLMVREVTSETLLMGPPVKADNHGSTFRVDQRIESECQSGDSLPDLQKVTGKDTGKQIKVPASTSRAFSKSDLKGGQRDGEGRAEKYEMGALGEGGKKSGKEVLSIRDSARPGIKRTHLDTHIEDARGAGCSSLGSTVHKQVGSSDHAKKLKDSGRGSKLSLEHKVDRQHEASRQAQNDGQSGQVSVAAIYEEKEKVAAKDLNVAARKKPKLSAKGSASVKQASKELSADACNETPHDLVAEQTYRALKGKELLGDSSFKKTYSAQDLHADIPKMQKELLGTPVHAEYSEHKGRREITEVVSVKDSLKGGKPRKKTNKEVTLSSLKEGENGARSKVDVAVELAFSEQATRIHAGPAPLSHAFESGEAGGPPIVVSYDQWVCCEACEKWRLAVPWVKVEDLPNNWKCEMMHWLPGKNDCTVEEDVTTTAVYALLGVAPVNPGGQVDAGQSLLQSVPPPKDPASGEEGKLGKTKVPLLKKGPTGKASPGSGTAVPLTKKGDGSYMKAKGLNGAIQQPQDHAPVSRHQNISRKGDLGLLKVDTRKEQPRRILGVEGEESRATKERVRKEELTDLSVEDTDSSCRSGAEKHGHLTLPGQGKKDMTKRCKDAQKRNSQGKRKTEVAENSAEVPLAKKVKCETSRSKELGGRVQDDAVHPSPMQNESAEDAEHSRKRVGSSRKTITVSRMKEASKGSSKAVEMASDYDDGSKREALPKDAKHSSGTGGDRGCSNDRRSLKEEGGESQPRSGKKRKVPIVETRDPDNKKSSKMRTLPSSLQEAVQEVFVLQQVQDSVDPGKAGNKMQTLSRSRCEAGNDIEGQGMSTSTNLRFSIPSSSSKSSASLSKGRGSPIESTVSSSPLRSPKADDRLGREAELAVDMMDTHYLPSHSSPKRSIDREADAQSDRSGPVGQSHRSWDDRPLSSDHDLDYRGSGRDVSIGRGREDRYASMQGGDGFRRTWRDDERYWDEHRDGRGGNVAYFAERHERVHEDRYREREGSLDRYRDLSRDGRYERQKGRDDRFRDRDRDRERDRDRVRENWSSERGEDRYGRDRGTREDWGRPSSRESRLDKVGGSHWIESSREQLRDERRAEDGTCDGKHDVKSKSPGRDVGQQDPEGNSFQQPSDSKALNQRQDKNLTKSASAWQSPFGSGMHWEGDRRILRKDVEAGLGRNAADAVPSVDAVLESGTGIRNKGDSSAADTSKRSREHVRSIEDATQSRKLQGKGAAGNAQLGKDSEGAAGSHAKEHTQAMSAANAAQREGAGLKHSADRMKHLGQERESTDLYLRAALKFLQAAFLYEPVHAEAAKLGEFTLSIKLYQDTAKLCEYCASSYERGGPRNLPAAALAHRCAAVARMRVLMAKKECSTRDRRELQASLQPTTQVPALAGLHTGRGGAENPSLALNAAADGSPSSSSASDVDNLNMNNQSSGGDKGPCTDKGSVLEPPLPISATPSGYSISAHAQQSLTRMMQDATDVHAALEALGKASQATAAAIAGCASDAELEAMNAVKKVGEDFCFGDLEATIRLVRLALEAIGH